jgi:metal-responsive CopG/Arc/MetJ family transcriptional regulator
METSTVNISFKKDLLKQIDKIAREEVRSRSELIREAAREYIERKNRWNAIFDFSDQQTSRLKLTPEDVTAEISKYRKRRRT